MLKWTSVISCQNGPDACHTTRNLFSCVIQKRPTVLWHDKMGHDVLCHDKKYILCCFIGQYPFHLQYLQLFKFFRDNNLLYHSQYEFKDGYLTEYTTLELIDIITLEMNTPFSIFLYLSKAFDTLDHQILIKKPQYYGLNVLAIKLMESYLIKRKQYVEIDDSESDILHFTTGVPQGFILGPLAVIHYLHE